VFPKIRSVFWPLVKILPKRKRWPPVEPAEDLPPQEVGGWLAGKIPFLSCKDFRRSEMVLGRGVWTHAVRS
jgi:hypothetical protein